MNNGESVNSAAPDNLANNQPVINGQPSLLLRKRTSDGTTQGYPNNKIFKTRKPTERSFSEKITQIIPESKLYNELLETEKRLDAIMLRKRLEYQDCKGKPCRVYRTVRLFISNLSSYQKPEVFSNILSDNSDGCIPSWTLKIEGRMLDLPAMHSKHKQPVRKFSSVVKSLVIELDPQVYPQDNIIEWVPGSLVQEVDGFEVKRHGSTNVKAKIILQMNSPADRFLPSEELKDIITIAPLQEGQQLNNLVTKADVVTTLWQYIKFYKLQDENDKLIILCDSRLKKLFNLEKITFSQLPFLLEKHLLPPEPIAIEYLIRVDRKENMSPVVFDIEIESHNEFKSKVTSILGNNSTNRAIYSMDEKIASLMTAINNAKIKRDFLLDFVSSPVHFINRWIASQAQDLEILYSDTQMNLEESRKANFYYDDWSKEAVFHYLMAQVTSSVELIKNLLELSLYIYFLEKTNCLCTTIMSYARTSFGETRFHKRFLMDLN